MTSGSSSATSPRVQHADYAQRLRSLVRERHRRERIWAWLSLAALLLCWDAAARLDEHLSVPRVRIAHAIDAEPSSTPGVRRH